MPKGNQLAADVRWKLGKQLEQEWNDDEKLWSRKSQADIAAELSEQHGITVTRQNVSAILRMAGLKQQIGPHQNTMMTREVAIALAATTLKCLELVLESADETSIAAIEDELNDHLTAIKGFLGLPDDPADDLDEENRAGEIPDSQDHPRFNES